MKTIRRPDSVIEDDSEGSKPNQATAIRCLIWATAFVAVFFESIYLLINLAGGHTIGGPAVCLSLLVATFTAAFSADQAISLFFSVNR